jgi:tetratricopeptide (TPR) repeat protein
LLGLKTVISSLISNERLVNRTKSFKVIAILLPFLILGLLEGVLRICHYGHDLRLFIESPADDRYLILNPDASRRYFSNQENATTGNIEPFKKKKDPGTLRIFVLGESTTIGYPYFHNGSFHRWLQYRLTHTFPDRNFEIINLSLTAVNSYTVLGFAKEVVNYEPDAVLIYAGHNEYYGALGVGSTDNIGGNRAVVGAILWLRGFRLVQLMANGMDWAVQLFGKKVDLTGKTRMELMVGKQEVAYGSKLFTRGIEQFRVNMDETLAVLHKRQIPVFISNLVSNEKDLPPFVSGAVDSTRYPGFAANYARGLDAMKTKDTAAAWSFFNTAQRVYGAHALCNYYLGRLAYGRGEFGEAKAWLDRARELDGLRFRAPDELNVIIAQLCHGYDNAHLVDAQSAFEANAEHHIIGSGLILEHVHPNLYGYALLSDVFYTAMARQGLFSVPKDAGMSFSQLLASMPITKVDSLTGVYKIFNLESSWPFSGGRSKDSLQIVSEEEDLAFNIAFKHMSWKEAMSNLYDYYIREKDLASAGTVLETLVLEYPGEAGYYEQAANICGELNDKENATFYFSKAFSLTPSFDKAKYLFVLYLKLDRPVDALPYLDYAIQNNPSGANLGAVKELTGQVIALEKMAAADPGNVSILKRIADAYSKMGNKEDAEKYTAMALKTQK